MNKNKTVLEGLGLAIQLEKSMVDYYKHAAEKDHHGALTEQFRALADRHFIVVGRLDSQRERLHAENGEGVIGHAIEAIGKAIFDTLAGLPVSAIRAETDLTIPSFIRGEEGLRAAYSHIVTDADPETATLAQAAIENCDENITRLNSMLVR
jgi:hypothetical protein